jgi:hypothetical protein
MAWLAPWEMLPDTANRPSWSPAYIHSGRQNTGAPRADKLGWPCWPKYWWRCWPINVIIWSAKTTNSIALQKRNLNCTLSNCALSTTRTFNMLVDNFDAARPAWNDGITNLAGPSSIALPLRTLIPMLWNRAMPEGWLEVPD